MKKLFYLIMVLLLLAITNLVNGQANYFSVRAITKGKEFSFPIFFAKNDSVTVQSINKFLQLSQLDLLNGYQKNNIFEKICIDNHTLYGGMVYMFFQIYSNNAKILSMKFNESSCGITCAYWVRYFNFNSGNGDVVQLKDLFTKEGFNTFKEKVFEKRRMEFKKEIAKADSNERKTFLNEVSTCYKKDDLHDYYIKDSSIFIDGENCLSKNEKFLGLNMKTRFDLKGFKSYLNNYGKVIFGIENDSISRYHSNELPQIFEGTIGFNKKIILILKRDYGNHMIGVYAYLKYGDGIYLEGELNKQKLIMTEKDQNFNNNEYIDASFDGKQIIGTWTNKDKTNSLKFIVARR